MNVDFLKSFKKFFFNSEKPEPVMETPKEDDVDTFDPYYEEMCVNDYHSEIGCTKEPKRFRERLSI